MKKILLVCAFALLFGLPMVASADINTASQSQIDTALQDLSSATGEKVTSVAEARQICDQEKYISSCAEVGKRNDLYSSEEIKKVDVVLDALKGEIASKLQSCADTECLVNVANELSQKIAPKNKKIASELSLTPAAVQEKRAIVTAAKEAGVKIDDCESMDPDSASIDLLRSCARLAKDSRVKKFLPETVSRVTEQKADSAINLRTALTSGELRCGNGTLEGCGNFCLNSGANQSGGQAEIPEVCRTIAKRFFGDEGIKQLEQAHQTVKQVQNNFQTKFVLTTPDGRELVGRESIRSACDQAFQQKDAALARSCGDFAVKNGFANKEDVERGVRLIETIAQKGSDISFVECEQNPQACEDFVPEEQKENFKSGIQMQQIMSEALGFDPRQCERAGQNEQIGRQCLEGAKKALPKLEALANQSPEARRIVEEIRGHVRQGEVFENNKANIEREFQSQQGGPGRCKSEGECRVYCSDATHGAECIAFGAKFQVFRGADITQRFQDYQESYQRTVDQSFPGRGPYPEFQPPRQDGVPPGQQTNFNQPGPSPECFTAIQRGEYERARELCRPATPIPPPPLPPGQTVAPGICPAYPYIPCPTGYERETYANQAGCTVFGQCRSTGNRETFTPLPTFTPYPTYSSGPSGGWINKTWKFKNGYTQYSSILNRTDSEYTNYINGVYSNCLDKYFAGWKSAGGDSSNWQEFGIPVCSATAPEPTGTSIGGDSGGCFYPNATKDGKSLGWTVWCQSDYYNCHLGTYSGDKVDTVGLSLGAPSSCYGAASTPYPTYSSSPGGSSCSASLINLLGDGCHNMGNAWFNGPMDRYVLPGTTAVVNCSATSIPSCSGNSGPYPSYSPIGGGQCPSSFAHDMGGYCMVNNGSRCAEYGNSANESSYTEKICQERSSTGPSYSPYPSCPSGQYWYTPSEGGAGYCKYSGVGPYPTYSSGPYPSYSSGPYPSYSYAPPSSCPSGQYWYYPPEGGSGYCKSSEPYPTYSSGPYPSYSSGPYPTYSYSPPPQESYSPPPTSQPPPSEPPPPPPPSESPAPPAMLISQIHGCIDGGGTWTVQGCYLPRRISAVSAVAASLGEALSNIFGLFFR